MSLILPSTTAPSQPVNPPSNATARSDEQGPNNLGSFGEVLSRSLAPAGEITEKTAGKSTIPTPARRQAIGHKTDPADLVNAMALPFVPLESRVVKAAPTGGAVAAPDNTVSAAATAPLTDLLMSTPVATEGSMVAKEVKDVNTGIGAQTVPGPALAAASQKNDGQATLQAKLNAMALPFVPLESRVVKAAPTGGAVAAPDNTVSAAATAPLTDLLVTTAVPTDGSMAAKDVKKVSAVSAAANAPLTDLSVSTPAPTDGAKEVKDVNTDAGAQTAPGPALAAASQKDAGQATLQAKLNAVSDSSALQLDPGKIAGQATAPNTGAPDQSSKRDNRAANKPDDMTAASADLTPAVTPALTHRTAKVVAAEAPPSAETAAIAITGSQAPTAETLSASAALPTNLVNAAAPGPAGAATSNTPSPVTTPSLSPEVGSSEWGKALGQQVIQMGKTGHQVAELQLNPPGLGPLKVTLSMNDNQIQAMFVSAHSSVRAAVEAALPQLRTSLADSGISLGNTSVSSGSQQQTAFAHSQNGQPDHRSYRSNSMVDTAALAARPVTEPLRQSNRITVDTYA